MFNEFKKFIMRGNVIDMAVGVITGAAFGRIVTSLVTDILMPVLGLLLGEVDFSHLYINLSNKKYASLAEAQAAGAATVNYGIFINTVIHFVIVAASVFLLVQYVGRLLKQAHLVADTQDNRECPLCISKVSIRAKRCAFCTAELPPVPQTPAP